MAVARDTESQAASTADATSLSWSHGGGSGSLRFAVVAVHTPNGGGTLSVTYGGVGMTAVPSGESSRANRLTKLFTLVAPPTGTQTVAISASVGQSIVGSCITFTGVDQSTPFGNVTSQQGAASANGLLTITSPDNSYVVVASCLAASGNVTAYGTGAVEFADSNSAGGTTNIKGHAVYNLDAGNPNLQSGWQRASGTTTFAMVGLAIYEAVSTNATFAANVATMTLASPAATLTGSGVMAGQVSAVGVAAPQSAFIGNALLAGELATIAVASPSAALRGEAALLAEVAALAMASPVAAFVAAAILAGEVAALAVAAPNGVLTGHGTLLGEIAAVALASPEAILIGEAGGGAVFEAGIAGLSFDAPQAALVGGAALPGQVAGIGVASPAALLAGDATLVALPAALGLSAPVAALRGGAIMAGEVAALTVASPIGALRGAATLLALPAAIGFGAPPATFSVGVILRAGVAAIGVAALPGEILVIVLSQIGHGSWSGGPGGAVWGRGPGGLWVPVQLGTGWGGGPPRVDKPRDGTNGRWS